MRIPLSWLAEFVTWSGRAAALAERLTMAGLKIEAIEEVGQLDRRIVAGVARASQAVVSAGVYQDSAGERGSGPGHSCRSA